MNEDIIYKMAKKPLLSLGGAVCLLGLIGYIFGSYIPIASSIAIVPGYLVGKYFGDKLKEVG